METKETSKKRDSHSHYKVIDGQLVPKKAYETEKEALGAAFFINSRENTIHKMVVYKCHKCFKWHIGSNGKELTEEDKEHYSNMLRNYKGFEKMTHNFFHKKK